VVYKIEDTMIYPVSNWAGKPSSADETKYAGHMTVTLLLVMLPLHSIRYLKVFQVVDLSSNFYFR